MRHSTVLLCLLGAAFAATAAPSPSPSPSSTASLSPLPPIIRPSITGKWTWTRSTNNCTEVYDYRSDGTLAVVSGEERTDNTYAIAATPDDNSFYRASMTTTRDYGGKDCGDSNQDNTGQTRQVYIRFNPSGDQHIVCQEPNASACFGPLRRVPGK